MRELLVDIGVSVVSTPPDRREPSGGRMLGYKNREKTRKSQEAQNEPYR